MEVLGKLKALVHPGKPGLDKSRHDDSSHTIFSYVSRCGRSGQFLRTDTEVKCPRCEETFAVQDGVMILNAHNSNQTEYFDEIYGSGAQHATEAGKGSAVPYDGWLERAKPIASLAGITGKRMVRNLDILDVACGTGWLTAGILSMPKVKHCRFHAFDVSIPGLKRLNDYAVALDTTNRLELSLQDADKMLFSEESFDIIFGNSVLHHFEDYHGFLNQCYSILKPGGCAIFGEPFAIGYGLAFGAMEAASQILKIQNKTVDYNYKDLRFRIANADNKLKLTSLVDKHLFFQGELDRTSRDMGYSAVRFAPADGAAYYREHVIEGLFREYAIEDAHLKELSKEIYGCFADLFGGEERYTETLPTFMHFVLVK